MVEHPPIFRLSLPPDAEQRSGESFRRDLPAEMYEEAERLGVFPVVYHNIGATGVSATDDSWDRRFRGVAVRNLALESIQKRFLGALRDQGIRCIPAKGVQLTRLLYPDLSWREITDIDLIVPPVDVRRAYECLKDLGLADTENPWNADALRRLARRPVFLYPELHLVGPHDVLVELHWDWTGERLPERDPSEDTEAYLVYLPEVSGPCGTFGDRMSEPLDFVWVERALAECVCDLHCSSSIQIYLRRNAVDWHDLMRARRPSGPGPLYSG